MNRLHTKSILNWTFGCKLKFYDSLFADRHLQPTLDTRILTSSGITIPMDNAIRHNPRPRYPRRLRKRRLSERTGMSDMRQSIEKNLERSKSALSYWSVVSRGLLSGAPPMNF